jgi:hypothetical protein
MATGIINECWRSIDGYINYQVSNIGRVRNADTGRILKPNILPNGYYMIGLYKDGKVKRFYIHRLVAHEFIENPNNKKFVDHIDNDRTNNCINNLRWATKTENGENRLKRKNTSSTYKGVHWAKREQKWHARITIDRKQKHLGYFDDEEEAARVYNEAAKQHFQEYAKLNDV